MADEEAPLPPIEIPWKLAGTTQPPGISSTLRDVVNRFNFGVIQVQPTGHGAEMQAVLAHEGNGFAFGLDVKDLILRQRAGATQQYAHITEPAGFDRIRRGRPERLPLFHGPDLSDPGSTARSSAARVWRAPPPRRD